MPWWGTRRSGLWISAEVVDSLWPSKGRGEVHLDAPAPRWWLQGPGHLYLEVDNSRILVKGCTRMPSYREERSGSETGRLGPHHGKLAPVSFNTTSPVIVPDNSLQARNK